MRVRLDVDARTLALRERLQQLVASGQIAAGDMEQTFDEEVAVSIRVDGRTLNRLERDGGPAAEAVRAYRKAGGRSADAPILTR